MIICFSKYYFDNEYITNIFEEVSVSQHFDSNMASGKVMKKAGMEYEVILRSRVINKDGRREDVHIYSSVI